MKIIKKNFIITPKFIFQGICIFWQHNKHTYISLKHNWVHISRFAIKANDSKGIHVYLKVWQNTHIHEMKAHDHNTNPNGEYKFKIVGIIKTKQYKHI